MRHFSGIRVWHSAHALAMGVYRLTSHFPPAHRFGLTAQLQRAALSVPTNIAEGAKRESAAEFARYLNIAEGSLGETRYLLLASRELGLEAEETIKKFESDAELLSKQLWTMKAAVRRQAAAGTIRR